MKRRKEKPATLPDPTWFTDGHVEPPQIIGFLMKIRADEVRKSKRLRPEMSISIIITAAKPSKSAQNDPELFWC